MSSPAPKANAAAVARPPSATHPLVALAGIAAFLLATLAARPINGWFVALLPPGNSPIAGTAATIMGFTALAIFALDLGWQHTHRRASTGLDFATDDPSVSRTLTKWLGLCATLGVIGALYWLLPEYAAPFYGRYFALLRVLVPAWLVVAWPYLYFVDRYQREPRDAYWQLGRLLRGHPGELRRAELGQHALGWLIKAFFLPLMFTYFCSDLERLLLGAPHEWHSFRDVYDFLYDFLYLIDVGLVSLGYLAALRLTDTHLRSAEPTMLGWVVALVCYEPFWSLIGARYLAYGGAYPWGTWFAAWPVLFAAWGSAILALTVIYVWATVCFGARFSNLTHRGIITNGPYRYCKHPAYLAKNLSWWLIIVPFLSHDSAGQALRHCALLGIVNGIYWLRAITEERHLSRDTQYVCYARFIAQHGLYARLRRVRMIR